jgi:hypothetical protein
MLEVIPIFDFDTFLTKVAFLRPKSGSEISIYSETETSIKSYIQLL